MTHWAIELKTARILACVEDGTGWLTFNNPERRNAVSLEMWQGMSDAMTAFEADPEVRVVVMRGAGGKSFAAGADISEFEQHRANAAQKDNYARIASGGQKGLANLSKPLIAMIDGFCIGGGLAIALNADIRFASPGSQFGIPAAKLGLGYDYHGLAALARFLGTGEALARGLINFVVEGPQLEQQVRDYATRIVANAPLTVHAAKQAMRVFDQYSRNPESENIERLVNQCFDSADYREGRRAFIEKRVPRFVGC
jgi:enoyl-CoA hydratase